MVSFVFRYFAATLAIPSFLMTSKNLFSPHDRILILLRVPRQKINRLFFFFFQGTMSQLRIIKQAIKNSGPSSRYTLLAVFFFFFFIKRLIRYSERHKSAFFVFPPHWLQIHSQPHFVSQCTKRPPQSRLVLSDCLPTL